MVQQDTNSQAHTTANSCWYCSLFDFARRADKTAAAHNQQQQQQQQQLGQVAVHDNQPGSTTASILAAKEATNSSNRPAQQLQLQQQQQQQQESSVEAAAAAAEGHTVGPGDCLGCRVTGLMLGLGGAGYVSSRLFEHPKPVGAHRYTLIGVSAGLAALGIARAIGL